MSLSFSRVCAPCLFTRVQLLICAQQNETCRDVASRPDAYGLLIKGERPMEHSNFVIACDETNSRVCIEGTDEYFATMHDLVMYYSKRARSSLGGIRLLLPDGIADEGYGGTVPSDDDATAIADAVLRSGSDNAGNNAAKGRFTMPTPAMPPPGSVSTVQVCECV